MKRLILFLALLCAVTALADDTVTVKVRGLGDPVEGWLRKIDDSRWVLQGPDRYYEIDGADIESVDGRKGEPKDSGKRVLPFTSYDEVLPDGGVLSWNRMEIVHRERRPMTYVQWGAKPHELEWTYNDFHLFDDYGNELEVERTPREDGGLSLRAELAVPVCENEKLTLVSRNVVKQWAWEENGVWTLSHNGDFPDDRLWVRKVRLPEGAEVLTVSPDADLFEHDGAPIVLWRRYYPKGVILPLTVTYRLP
jgi:hypothetical protein